MPFSRLKLRTGTQKADGFSTAFKPHLANMLRSAYVNGFDPEGKLTDKDRLEKLSKVTYVPCIVSISNIVDSVVAHLARQIDLPRARDRRNGGGRQGHQVSHVLGYHSILVGIDTVWRRKLVPATTVRPTRRLWRAKLQQSAASSRTLTLRRWRRISRSCK